MPGYQVKFKHFITNTFAPLAAVSLDFYGEQPSGEKLRPENKATEKIYDCLSHKY